MPKIQSIELCFFSYVDDHELSFKMIPVAKDLTT